jgi:hypothetical protein
MMVVLGGRVWWVRLGMGVWVWGIGSVRRKKLRCGIIIGIRWGIIFSKGGGC